MKINLIVAVSENGIIGANNSLVWHLKDDLKRFQSLTNGRPIIMGRKTYESIGKPLPNRINIIVTSNEDYVANDCIICPSLSEAIDIAKGIDSFNDTFIIGGSQIYKQALDQNIVDKVYLTRVHATVEGDTSFSYDFSNWKIESQERIEANEKNHFSFTFYSYIK